MDEADQVVDNPEMRPDEEPPMPEPDEVRFACIGCGAMNPAGAEACSGCGHRFGGPAFTSPDPPIRAPAPPENPYAPPTAKVGKVPALRIGTMMALIAVIAACMGAFAADLVAGYVVTIGLLPASIRTFAVAYWREAEGRPMRFEDQCVSFFWTIGAVYLIVVSSFIAFCLTCVPIGFVSGNALLPAGLIIAVGCGLVTGVATGIGLTRALLKVSRERDEREGARDQIRWR